jgi:NADPH:quinone reductase-like Zn-dependent oxidoreductase
MRTEGQNPARDDHSRRPGQRATMRAIVQDSYGSADVLRLAQIARPTPADNEVLLRVRAAGVDRGAWHLMRGRPFLARAAFGLTRPKNPVPGTEVAGTVVAVGSGVTRFAIGHEVFGVGQGAFAEYTVVREDKLAAKPVNASFEQAAALAVSAATAVQALVDVGHVEAGQSVLVLGASGGVGSYAVQVARAKGASVTGVCSTAKRDLVRSLGAEHVLDYTRDDFADGTRCYDLILDIAGRPSLRRLRRALAATGTAVIVGGEEGGEFSGGMNRQLRALALTPFVRQRLTMFIASPGARDFERLTDLVEAGAVTPSIDRSFPLDRAAEAMRYLEAGTVRGKVVIAV